jgi:hypothetical protein
MFTGLVQERGHLKLPDSSKQGKIPFMNIDLADLREMHPRLPEDLALVMVGRAALSLQKNGHGSPVRIRLDVDRAVTEGDLIWPVSDPGFLDQHDTKRLTDDGAEAMALVLGHQARGWRVVRRLQQGEHADWLLEESSGGQTSGSRWR